MNGDRDEDIRRLERAIAQIDAFGRQFDTLERDMASDYAEMRTDLEKMQVTIHEQAVTIAGLLRDFWVVRAIALGFAALVLTTFGALLVNLVWSRPTP